MDYSPFKKPQDIATLFAQAWARRDADGIAALFDENAEFVNVTGLWWHDRAAIRKAHAYGFETIFSTSTLRLMDVRVRMLADTIAVVHARIRLEGQSGAAGVEEPSIRNTIFCFVVHRTGDTWSCASAQNTDIVPGMETNIVGADGRLRPVSYRG